MGYNDGMKLSIPTSIDSADIPFYENIIRLIATLIEAEKKREAEFKASQEERKKKAATKKSRVKKGKTALDGDDQPDELQFDE
jgi:hypothetical protein